MTAPLVAGRLASERLLLDPLVVGDAEEMVRVLADPALYAHTGGEPPDLGSLGARYARQVRGRSSDGTALWLNWIIRTSDMRRAVGYVQVTFTIEQRTAELAWVIGTDYQRRGYATEAAKTVVNWLAAQEGVTRMIAHISATNLPSEKVARRLGFVPTEEIEGGETVWEWGPDRPEQIPRVEPAGLREA